MLWSRETGEISLNSADIHMLSNESDRTELIDRLLKNEVLASEFPSILTQRMLPLLME